jgi:hypothetical protein
VILLDTDHVTVLGYPESESCQRLLAQLTATADPVVAVTWVTPGLHFENCLKK